MIQTIIRFLSFFVFFFIVQLSSAQLSRKHFIPPLTSSDGFTDQYIYISTPKNNNVSYKIIPVGNPELQAYSGVVSNQKPVKQSVLDLTGNIDNDADSQLHVPTFDLGNIYTNKGFIIEAEDDVYVSVRVRSFNTQNSGKLHASSLVSKGNAALGTQFRIGAMVNEEEIPNSHLAFASIMATEDQTILRIYDITGITLLDKILNKNESYIYHRRGSDLLNIIGCLISSSKPVVVNTGSALGSFAVTRNNPNPNLSIGGQDYGFDQIVDTSKIGTQYILVRGAGGNEFENALVIAHEDNTSVSVGGSSTPIITLNAGEYIVLEGNNYSSNGNMYINTSKKTFVYQGIGGINSRANQDMFFVPPLSCENTGNVDNIAFINQVDNSGESFDGGITIVTNTDAIVKINNEDISSLQNVQGPFNVNGNSNYVTYKVADLSGNIRVSSDKELYCAYFNFNSFATSGSFYSGFPSAPEISFVPESENLGNCLPNIRLKISNDTGIFDYFWEYFDEISSDWFKRGKDNEPYEPILSEPGRYRLNATIICTGLKLPPFEIPVSICPDDFDGDGIEDNIDVDIDNDGILNIDESRGDATINITDINKPILIFQDNSSNTSFITGNLLVTETTSSFLGQDNGNFISTVQPNTSNSDLVYELNFDQSANIQFTQTSAATNNTNVFYIVKIGPSSKNITLLDPNNQLLVDSNFDGDFTNEFPITKFSNSEIRFKINPNVTGPITYRFVANHITQFSIEIKSNGLTDVSTFSGNIKLTTFSKDSDGDGIEDMFDVDSDNDGIPDVFEATASKITLLDTDANLDGLNDVFEGITTGIDTDGDGIPNHLDVDADNDGIFDLVEAGHGGLDDNNDGILENSTAENVGINGLLNSLESTVDSKILSLNYTISDTDNDSIFNFLELDSDNDACFDVIEAGFTGTSLGILFANPFAVSANGKVINNTNGYSIPNLDYITSAPIILNTPFENAVFCENITDVISIDSTADQFQWEVSNDNGATWTTIIDNAIYSGATTKDLQITNPPLTFDNYQFKVFLDRTGNTCGKESNTIVLTVNPEPILKPNPELFQCIDDGNTNPTVNLTLAEKNITDETNVTFKYFEDIAGTNEITEPTSYPVVVNTTQSVYVRVTSEFDCYANLIELKINIGQTPDNPYNDIQPAVCDDFLDADGNDTANNSDTDNITQFNLDKTAIENGINPPANTVIFYYENAVDRTNSLNEIDITNYRNNINKIEITNIPSGIQFPIYYKILSTINNDCQGLGEFYLQINAVPEANSVNDLELCDDANDGDSTNGIVQNFDLESQTSLILGTQNPADFTVTYHVNQADTETGNNPITSPFTNTIRDLQTIFVRATNNATGCFTNHTSFNVIVNPLPIANFVEDLEVCDDNADGSARNGFSQSIDLESQSSTILGSQDASIYKVTYHRTLADAQAGNNPLNSPYSNTIPNRETIFVRVFNENTQCANGISQFDVIINPEPTFQTPTNLAYCDTNDDGDDTNGIIQTIDLDSKISEILGNSQSPNDFTVTFHASQMDATNGISPILSPYTNTNLTERIFVRIQNKRTLCFNDDAFFDLIVNPLPSFTVTSPQIICLNDLPLNLSVENPRDVYTYEWKNESGKSLGTDDNLNITTGGNYFVTATSTNGTLCSRTEMIEVNESNIATLQNSFVTVIDESTNIGSQNNLSISIDIISNNLGPGDYQFAIVNTDTSERFPFAGFQDDPLFENLEGGIYQIIVNDKNGCSPDATLLVSVIQFPKFFTPNGDGQNDTWVVKGANQTFYPNASINIFNRYGKLVAQIPIDSQGWNGTYNGTLLPSDDYWYNVTLIPADTTKPTINKKGNFSLIRK